MVDLLAAGGEAGEQNTVRCPIVAWQGRGETGRSAASFHGWRGHTRRALSFTPEQPRRCADNQHERHRRHRARRRQGLGSIVELDRMFPRLEIDGLPDIVGTHDLGRAPVYGCGPMGVVIVREDEEPIPLR